MCERVLNTARPLKSDSLLLQSRKSLHIYSSLVSRYNWFIEFMGEYTEIEIFAGLLSNKQKKKTTENRWPKLNHKTSSEILLRSDKVALAQPSHSSFLRSPLLSLVNLRPWGKCDNTYLNILTAPQPSCLLANLSTGGNSIVKHTKLGGFRRIWFALLTGFFFFAVFFLIIETFFTLHLGRTVVAKK